MTPDPREPALDDPQLGAVLVTLLELYENGRTPNRAAWLADYPQFATELQELFDSRDQVAQWTAPLRALAKSVPEQPPPALADYALLREIGRGGMGVVYEARQKSLNRLVALKMIRAGSLASAAEARRFRGEAEAAASLDHPHIVPIYEVGESQGQPYFTMKLMAGGSLSEGVRDQGSGVSNERQRRSAEIVASVARAVHHAHRRGILHRDLKPSNILLDAAGQPHVTDFGLAKRLEATATVTDTGAIVGTPTYMAPEQALGKQGTVTTATDVYGLGGILFALLTGRPPFVGDTPLETLAQVQGREPRLPTGFSRRVDRDLETVCLKCLEKDPAARYGSAEALAEDLERWLAGEPIVARPVSRAARTWRWCRRNPVLAGLCAIVASLLLSVSLISCIAAFSIAAARDREEAARNRAEDNAEKERLERQRATRAERLAHEEADRANGEALTSKQLADFLLGIFQSSDPYGYESVGFRAGAESGQKLLARDLLDRAAERIEAEFKGPNLTKASLMDGIGDVYRSLGIYDKAETLLRQSFQIRSSQLPADHLNRATSLFHLALLHYDLAEYQQAEALFREAIAIREKHWGPKHLLVAEIKFHLAWVRNQFYKSAEAEELLREVLEIRTKELGSQHRQVAITRAVLVVILMHQRKDTEAMQLGFATLDASDVVQGTLALERAIRFRKQRNFAESEKAYREMLVMSRRTLGSDHPFTVTILGDLAGLMREKGDLVESERFVLQILAVGRTFMNDHPLLVEVRVEYAKGLLVHKRFAEAEKHFLDALSSVRKRPPTHGPTARTIVEHLVHLYEAWGKPDKAAEHRALLDVGTKE